MHDHLDHFAHCLLIPDRGSSCLGLQWKILHILGCTWETASTAHSHQQTLVHQSLFLWSPAHVWVNSPFVQPHLIPCQSAALHLTGIPVPTLPVLFPDGAAPHRPVPGQRCCHPDACERRCGGGGAEPAVWPAPAGPGVHPAGAAEAACV